MVVLGSGPALMAHDVSIPPWRGDPGSTYQHWSFDDNTSPQLADQVDNPYGDPGLTSCPSGTWASENDDGYLDDINSLVVFIPNQTVENPLKKVQVQVAYRGGAAPQYQLLAAYCGMPPSTELLMPTDVATETVGEWTVDVVSFEIEPNPWFETVYATWPEAVDVTQVVVDTICIPEPATLAMLAIGFGLAFLRRR
jgi:hypothetical protein